MRNYFVRKDLGVVAYAKELPQPAVWVELKILDMTG